MILPALVSHLLNDQAVSALVGNRIHAEEIPPSTSETPNQMPLLTYELLDEPVKTSHDKKYILMARVQISAWGGSYKSSHAAAAAVFTSLHGYRGAMGNENFDVGGCFRKSNRDNKNAENVDLFCVEQIFEIHYKENYA